VTDRRCQHCSRPLSGALTARRRYCDATCRQAEHRARSVTSKARPVTEPEVDPDLMVVAKDSRGRPIYAPKPGGGYNIRLFGWLE
jgi:hypothetical protein